MMIPMVDLKAQHKELQDEIQQGIQAVVDSACFILGPNVVAFEEEAAGFLGAAHAVTCASGTDALHLALVAAGIGPGDQVITSPFTFIATAEAICYVGARPVFVDIDPRTFNLAIDQVEAAITPTTRAIMPVHLFGQAVPMGSLMAIAERHDLKIIEDCAQSFGAASDGSMTGTFGTAGCFSFFPSKNLGGYGDGGMIATRCPEYAERLRVLRNHGSRTRYHHHVIGYNSRLDELQAVVLRAKLKRLKRYNEARRRVASRYREGLIRLPHVTPPQEGAPGTHVYHQYTILTPRREAIMAALQTAGIGCAIYYPVPLHRQEVFAAQYSGQSLPVAEGVARQCLSLPIFPEMTEAQVDTVVSVIEEVVDDR
jgi:dTDP-4-amino-4,6-dideoxygalactose transaminase